jgi:sucrose-6-phosphate hydrolase SacC (GH32 family)
MEGMKTFSKNIIIDSSPKAALYALSEAGLLAAMDTERPSYHYHPISQWMNDANGCYYKDGWYHVFHLQDPFSSRGDSKAQVRAGLIFDGDKRPNRYWAHARSRDLLNWEYLPLALWPDRTNGEANPISGDSIVREDGSVLLFFTAKQIDSDSYVQRAAISYDEINWKRIQGNLLELSDIDHKVDGHWRDPFVWKYKHEYYMIIGAETEKNAELLIFRAVDKSLLHWEYKGVFLSQLKENTGFFECPRLCKISNKWVLIFSPYTPVEYYIGTIDWHNLRFQIENNGKIDGGTQAYASVLIKNTDPPVLLSWIPGWNNVILSEYWNGVLSVPRTLSICNNRNLEQRIHPAVSSLRKEGKILPPALLRPNCPHTLAEGLPDRCEIELHFHTLSSSLQIDFLSDSKYITALVLKNGRAQLDEISIPLTETDIYIRIFVDGCVWEIFFENVGQCLTKVLTPAMPRISIVAEAKENEAAFCGGRAWELKAVDFSVKY